MKIGKPGQAVAGFYSRLIALTAISLTLVTASTSRAALVFDDVTNAQKAVPGATLTATTATPNTFMGGAYTLAPGTVDITGFDVFPYNASGINYIGLQLTIYVWGKVNTGTVNTATPAFSNLLNSYTVTRTGSFATGSYFRFENATPGAAPGISLTTPLVLATGTTVGITLACQGTTDGITYTGSNNLTSVITFGTAPTMGSEVFNGFYRNANAESNGNFTSPTRMLTSGTNQGLALRVFGDAAQVPEPGTGGMFLLAAAGLLTWRRWAPGKTKAPGVSR